MHVYEAGGDPTALRVDLRCVTALEARTDADDPAVADQDVSTVQPATCPIEHRGIAYEHRRARFRPVGGGIGFGRGNGGTGDEGEHCSARRFP